MPKKQSKGVVSWIEDGGAFVMSDFGASTFCPKRLWRVNVHQEQPAMAASMALAVTSTLIALRKSI